MTWKYFTGLSRPTDANQWLWCSRTVKPLTMIYWLSWLSYSGLYRTRPFAGVIVTNPCSSWTDRVPFVLLFGIATSVALFHERLARSASRLLSGAQFDVENTSIVLERIFRKTVTGVQAPLRLGGNLITSLMARQSHHVQSVQSFTTALKVGSTIPLSI